MAEAKYKEGSLPGLEAQRGPCQGGLLEFFTLGTCLAPAYHVPHAGKGLSL